MGEGENTGIGEMDGGEIKDSKVAGVLNEAPTTGAGKVEGNQTIYQDCTFNGASPEKPIKKPEEKRASKRIGLHIGTTFLECDRTKLEAIAILLREISGDDSIKIIDLDEGSIKLILEGSEEGLKRIEELFASGELTELEGIAVEDVHPLSEEEEEKVDEKLRLVEEILALKKIYRDKADLFRVDLEATNLRGAKLRGADLFRADLRGADLFRADLRGADLRGADLRGADLGTANLRAADLRKANLVRANLQKANLSRANLEGAKFGDNEGISEEMKADFIQRGAIFIDSPGSGDSFAAP